MSDWKAELDALVSETMDFARNLRSQLPVSIGRPEPTRPEPEPSMRGEPVRLEPMNWGGSEREEIQRRVASFKAHQQQHTRQREDYAASEWKRMLASRSWRGASEQSGRGEGPNSACCPAHAFGSTLAAAQNPLRFSEIAFRRTRDNASTEYGF